MIGSLVLLVFLPERLMPMHRYSVGEEGSVPGGVFEALFQVEESDAGQIHFDGLV